jgi:ribonuclease HII
MHWGKMLKPNFDIEKGLHNEGFFFVAGVDEVGRGCLAGPVVAASVILPDLLFFQGINDSKKLSPKKREDIFDQISVEAISIGVGIIEPDVIDEINILQASLKAMECAIQNCNQQPDYVLLDGRELIASSIPQKPIIKGDSISLSIAAASIIAKVTRDRMMVEKECEFPGFSFSVHKGYPTKQHKSELQHHGATPIHRRSFRGVI